MVPLLPIAYCLLPTPYSRISQMQYNNSYERFTKTIRAGRVYRPVVYRDFSCMAVSRAGRGEMAWRFAVGRRPLGRVGNILSIRTASELV